MSRVSSTVLPAAALRIVALVLCGCAAAPAMAHGLRVFAAAQEGVIEGRAYTDSGAGVAGAAVRIFDSQGVALGETLTSADGAFAFQASAGMDYRIVVDSGDGHRVAVTVKAGGLPAGGNEDPELSEPGNTSSPNPTDRTPVRISPEALQAVVEKAVARQVRPLREALHAYESRVRWHDVLGGIGYILGVAGIVFYLLGRRRRGGGS